jgi:hypothetical protein
MPAVHVVRCQLDYYDVSLEILAVYLQSFPGSAVAVNLKACNHFRLYNGAQTAWPLWVPSRGVLTMAQTAWPLWVPSRGVLTMGVRLIVCRQGCGGGAEGADGPGIQHRGV